MMVMPLLYNFDLDDQCYRVRLTASILAIDLDIESVNAFPGRQHLAAPYVLVNPIGRLPALAHNDRTFKQVSAIQLYLNSLSDVEGLVPDEPEAYCAMMDWLIFADRDLSCVSSARAISLMDVSQNNDDDLRFFRSQARRMFRIMEDHLSEQRLFNHQYFIGSELSLADIALFPAFALSRDINIDHDEYPALRTWMRKIRSVDGFITMPGIPDFH